MSLKILIPILIAALVFWLIESWPTIRNVFKKDEIIEWKPWLDQDNINKKKEGEE